MKKDCSLLFAAGFLVAVCVLGTALRLARDPAMAAQGKKAPPNQGVSALFRSTVR